MADEVILLDFWASLFGMRVKIALAEKGIKYECKEELWNKSSLTFRDEPHSQEDPSSHPQRETVSTVISAPAILILLEVFVSNPSRSKRSEQSVYYVSRKVLTTKGEELEAGKKDFIETFKILEGELGD
ncbi:probable glutathione S-transferase [Quercus suber]|uniref:probable glutathione S-transferase n=1 Tax=Quercus suber TaxID=58331 RepID=UPI0032E03F86